LTASLQLRRRSRPSRARASGLASVLVRRWRHSVLAGAAIDSPSERRRPAAVLSTACRARHLTSGALCRAPRLPGRNPSSAGSQTQILRRLVKAGDLLESERLPSIGAPSREPATVLATSPPRAGFGRPFTPRAPPVSRRGREARPPHRCGGRTPPIDFCNQTIREHVQRTARSPARSSRSPSRSRCG